MPLCVYICTFFHACMQLCLYMHIYIFCVLYAVLFVMLLRVEDASEARETTKSSSHTTDALTNRLQGNPQG